MRNPKDKYTVYCSHQLFRRIYLADINSSAFKGKVLINNEGLQAILDNKSLF